MRSSTIVVIGAGTAGTTVAARLHRAGAQEVTVIDPSPVHYYQPLWTLVGGGRARPEESCRPRAEVLPLATRWIQGEVVGVDPERNTVQLRQGTELGYGQLVVAPGIQLDWKAIPGMEQAVAEGNASSNYRFDLAPRTWELIRSTTSGAAVFSMPSGPVKCAGAPQKIAYLAADHWRRTGVLDDIDIHLVLPTPAMFGVEKFAGILDDTARDYGMTVHLSSQVVAVDAERRSLTVEDGTGRRTTIDYAMAHLVPPHRGPEWIKGSGLADPDDPAGCLHVDPHTLQHPRYPRIFGLGDAASVPTSKTGAAVRHQAPVVVENMRAAWQGRPLTGWYDGYSSCPLTLSRRRLLLAEFDYAKEPTPTNPLPWPDTTEPLVDFNLFKRVALPTMYWHFMLKGVF